MQRRDFVKNTALLSSSLLLNLEETESTKKYKFGIQLFTLNKDMNADPLGTLQKVRSFGFEDCEVFGFDGEKLSFYGIPAKDFKKRLEDNQLTVSSGHFGFAPLFDKLDVTMMRFVDQCIEGAHALGMKYITWPFVAPEHRTMADFLRLTEKLNKIGRHVYNAGLGFAYHNHGYEFVDLNGVTAYDIIIKETDPDYVKLQLDLYWVMHSSSKSPKQWIANHPGRFVMWHIKDMHKESRDYTELGNGSIDYTSILPDKMLSGMEFYYLEQGGNFAHSALKSVEDSASYFQKNLKSYF